MSRGRGDSQSPNFGSLVMDEDIEAQLQDEFTCASGAPRACAPEPLRMDPMESSTSMDARCAGKVKMV
jgi:hypothetical protein